MVATKKAFIIDDDLDLCFLLKTYLQKNNYEVETYNSLTEGLHAIEEQQPGLLFLDNNLPDGLGWSKIGEISDQFPDLRIHLLSGYQYTPAALNRGKKIKIWQKPITFNDLDLFFKTQLK